MYFSKIKFKNSSDNPIWNLILETVSNVHYYADLMQKKNERDMIETWKNFQEGADRGHGTIKDSMASRMLGVEVMKLEGDEPIKPQTAYAETFKSFQNIYETMATIIATVPQKPVRVSRLGGYSPFDKEIYEETETLPFSDKRFYNWLMKEGSTFIGKKEPVDDVLSINRPNIVIENQHYISDEFRKEIKEVLTPKIDYYSIINNFDIRTDNYTESDFIEMINNWIDSGLEKIFVETTLKNKKQFYGLLGLLKDVAGKREYDIDFYLQINPMFYHDVEKFLKGSTINLNLL